MNRRRFLLAAAGVPAGGLALPRASLGTEVPETTSTSIRGSLSATELGVRPNATDDQSEAFARMLDKAARENTPLFLPPGVYSVSGITLPRNLRLSGIPGATRILYGGGDFFFRAEGAERIELTGLVIDGADRWLSERVRSALDMRAVRRFVLEDCEVVASGRDGVALERSGGRIVRSSISGAADAAIYTVDATGLEIAGNTILGCANGGILVHRRQAGHDGTIVSANRIERIGARKGGTGQNGNGINLFRADDVSVSGNHVADCAFSAIRANSASNAMIASNTCLRAGETAIYAEFAFQGAVINANIIDGAANGISMTNFDEGGRLCTCSGNLVRNLSAAGPYDPGPHGFGWGISVQADSSVIGNVIEAAPLTGISIGWGPFMRNVVASGNVIRQAGTGIAVSVVEGTGSAVIAHNIIEGARNGAIVGYRWAEPVTGDLAAGGAARFQNLTIEGNQVL